MIRRSGVLCVEEPVSLLTTTGISIGTTSRRCFVVVVEESFGTQDEALSVLQSIVDRDTMHVPQDERIGAGVCPGTGRLPAGSNPRTRLGVCATCRRSVDINALGLVVGHPAERQDDERATGGLDPASSRSLLETD